MNYRETTEYLFSAMPSFQHVGGDAYKPGLERIEAFCELLGNPHLSYPTIHVAGSNGKGSTSNMLAAALRSSGRRVGLFTSPHLRDFRERMRVDGEVISEGEVVDFVEAHRADMERFGLSFFEMTAAMAFDFFARAEVDIVVVECGLGGRLDATNVVKPELSIITNIALEHTKYLGDTLAKIAGEKGGIIKYNSPVVIGERDVECDGVFERIAAERGAEITFAEDRYRVVGGESLELGQRIDICRIEDGEMMSLQLDLMGEYQRRNIVTLLAAADILGLSISDVAKGVADVCGLMRLEGRWQIMGREPLVVCDTGHNAHGLKFVAEQIARQQYDRLYCVLGLSNDKDLDHILGLFPRDAHYIFTRPKVERAYTTAQIAEVASAIGLSFECVEDVAEALDVARFMASSQDMIFVGGSNFVVAEVL